MMAMTRVWRAARLPGPLTRKDDPNALLPSEADRDTAHVERSCSGNRRKGSIAPRR